MNYMYYENLKELFFDYNCHCLTYSNLGNPYLTDLEDGVLFYNFHSLLEYLDSIGVGIIHLD